MTPHPTHSRGNITTFPGCKLPGPSSGVKGLPVTDPLVQKVIRLVALRPRAYEVLNGMVDRYLEMAERRGGW